MSDLRFFDLSIPAPRRLAMMRTAFARHSADYPHCPEYAKPTDWREVRAWGLHSYDSAFGLASPCPEGVYSFDRDSLPVRNMRFADDAYSGIRHKGWFTGNHENGTVRGIVASLPHGRFLSGYHNSDNNEYVIFDSPVFGSDQSAAIVADRKAQACAESLREDNARFDAMRDAEEHANAAAADVKRAFQARNVSPWHRDNCRERIAELRIARKTFAEKTTEYEGSC